jgi:hypothetical protein
LKTEFQEFENMIDERNALIIRVKCTEAHREAMRKERDTLRLEVENLLTERYDAAVKTL